MNKIKAFLIPIVLTLSLVSCNKPFDDFFTTVKEIVVEDLRNAYSVGQVFYDRAELDIHVLYSDGTVKEVDYRSASLMLKNENKTYSAKSAFTVSGTYSLTVTYGQKTSMPIDITVYENENYVSSLVATPTKTDVKTMEEIEISLDINPTEYTVDLECELSNREDYIEKTDKNTFLFYAESEGTSTVTFKAKSGAETYVSQVINFTVSKAANEVNIEQTYKDLDKTSSPTTGDVKYLLIPVWLSDSSNFVTYSKRDNIVGDIEKAYFGTESQTGWNSVSSYYKTESQGKLNLTGTVSDWYETNLSTQDLGMDDSSKTDNKTRNLIKSAVNWYFENNTEDARTNYDSDGDGRLDGVVVIYAAPDCNAFGVDEYYKDYSNLWAYCSRIGTTTPSLVEPTVETFFWASYDFMYGYLDAIERTGNKYHKGTTAFCTFDTHTYIHETGHILGLSDYYDYSAQYNPAGGFSMQDYNVGGHDPFSVMAYGWANPIIPTETSRIRIGAFQKTREFILLTPSWNSYNSPFDEYLILELYTPTGLNTFDTVNQYTPLGAKYPQGPNSVGIRLWHVDARLTYPTSATTYSETLTCDASGNNRFTAFSNTYMKGNVIGDHCSRLCIMDLEYSNYNLLQLIRNNEKATYKNKSLFSGSDLFKAGDGFSMETFASQFAYRDSFGDKSTSLLNNGEELGWSFIVESVSKDSAIIKVIK